MDEQQRLFSGLVVPGSCQGDAVVEIEVVVIIHVSLDAIEVDVDVLELAHKEVARGHALSARDGVALMG